MKADKTLLRLAYGKVIETLAEMQGITLRQALDIFYKSQVYVEMSEGISDMHCRSEKYLAEEIMRDAPPQFADDFCGFPLLCTPPKIHYD